MVVNKHKITKIIIIMATISVLLACNLANVLIKSTTPETKPEPSQISGTPSSPQEPAKQAEEPKFNITPLATGKVYLAAFADYPSQSSQLPASFSGGYSLPVNLQTVQDISKFTFSKQQQDLLTKNGFYVEPPEAGKYREFYQIYEQNRYDEGQFNFITTDSVFHIYHLIFDKMLRTLERQYFIPYLERLTQSMLQATAKQFQELKGSPLEDPSRRNMAYFGVAAKILGLKESIPAEAQELVNSEFNLIEGHQGAAVSPIWDRPDLSQDMKLIEDYSQYIPRGHYTRDEGLKRYFKAMMWYGRLTFRLTDDFETRRALLLVQALRNAPQSDGVTAQQLWENVYSPTVFIIGKSDDLSQHEYGVISDSVFGVNPDLKSFSDDTNLAKFKEAAKILPPPQINSMWVWIWQDKKEVTPGLRFMGQRFTLDAYVFGQVMWRNVGTQGNERDLPKGLDLFAAMGSDEAYNILKVSETKYANYTKQMDKVRQEIPQLKEDSWTQSLYWGWLYSFQPLISPKGEQYPPFMRSQAWSRKDLHTGLGSWTELKHDTILYAKQVMAEMGGGGPETAPRGYIEPNPDVYGRLLSLCKMTYNGLQARGILDADTKDNLEKMEALLNFLKVSSEKELAGQTLSEDDYWEILYFGGKLEALTLAAADKSDENSRDLQDRKAALVADVATGINRVLEEGVGQPTRIFVVIPDQPFRIGIGAVYTYYEFQVPPAERLTDEQWQAKVEKGDLPPVPDWTSSFYSK
ncbi:MAG: DUF3160 domain-containing protein [Chloroflexota bacterium]